MNFVPYDLPQQTPYVPLLLLARVDRLLDCHEAGTWSARLWFVAAEGERRGLACRGCSGSERPVEDGGEAMLVWWFNVTAEKVGLQ